MPGSEPEPNDPLGPYSPSEVPAVPGDGRTGFALLLALLLLLSAAYGVLSLAL